MTVKEQRIFDIFVSGAFEVLLNQILKVEIFWLVVFFDIQIKHVGFSIVRAYFVAFCAFQSVQVQGCRHLCKRRVRDMVSHKTIHDLFIIRRLIEIEQYLFQNWIRLFSKSQKLLVDTLQTFKNALFRIKRKVRSSADYLHKILGPL